jgi:hypothetical protein
MEPLLHLMGVCSDTHTHFDLLDLFLAGGATTSLIYFKLHIKIYFEIVKDFFRRK